MLRNDSKGVVEYASRICLNMVLSLDGLFCDGHGNRLRGRVVDVRRRCTGGCTQ